MSETDETKEATQEDNYLKFSVGNEINGTEIIHIYFVTKNYIIYLTKYGFVACEIGDITNIDEPALTEWGNLSSLKNTYLSERNSEEANFLLATALNKILSSGSKKLDASLFINISKYFQDNMVKEWLFKENGFEIYKDKISSIQWYCKNLPDHLIPAIDEFEQLKALIKARLRNNAQEFMASEMLVSALKIAVRKEKNEDIKNVFANTRKFIFSQVESELRVNALFFTIYIPVFLCATLFYLSGLELDKQYLIPLISGIIGATISCLQRNKDFSFDPYMGSGKLICEVISRLFIGAIFGVLVLVLAKSELALAPFKDNLSALIVFSFIAGFSERFMPDLIATVSDKGKNSN